MSAIEKIQSMWEVDCMIDPTQLTATQAQTPILHAKYLKYLNAAKKELREKEAMRPKVLHMKTEYYMGNLDKETLEKYGWKQCQRKILNSDLPRFLNADDDIISLNKMIAECHALVDMITDILKQISNRGFAVKNIIDYEKFLHGR